jgi:hypothetical protein
VEIASNKGNAAQFRAPYEQSRNRQVIKRDFINHHFEYGRTRILSIMSGELIHGHGGFTEDLDAAGKKLEAFFVG